MPNSKGYKAVRTTRHRPPPKSLANHIPTAKELQAVIDKKDKETRRFYKANKANITRILTTPGQDGVSGILNDIIPVPAPPDLLKSIEPKFPGFGAVFMRRDGNVPSLSNESDTYYFIKDVPEHILEILRRDDIEPKHPLWPSWKLVRKSNYDKDKNNYKAGNKVYDIEYFPTEKEYQEYKAQEGESQSLKLVKPLIDEEEKKKKELKEAELEKEEKKYERRLLKRD